MSDTPPEPNNQNDDECEELIEKDEEICRNLKSPAARARCWQSANDRYAACKAGKPLPLLVTE
jgi:hypothetical protein